MNWIETSSKFRYCGKPVIRKKAICKTIIGIFEVYEAVGGKVFVRHPFVRNEYIGPTGFNNGLEDWFGKPKELALSYETGMDECNRVLKAAIEKLKLQANEPIHNTKLSS